MSLRLQNPGRPLRAVTTSLLVLTTAVLAACSLQRPHPDKQSMGTLPSQWQAPAIETENARSLATWWSGWGDTVLDDLLAQAQQNNYSLAQAGARINQARADAVAAGASLWPNLDLNASATSTRSPLQLPVVKESYATSTLDARWELDLFGGARAGRDASQARVGARESEWQDARISLSAEVANAYVGLRSCEAQQIAAEKIVTSQQLSQNLQEQKTLAGFISAVELAQSNTLLANAYTQLQQQKTECAVMLKSLAILTVMPETELRDKLAVSTGKLPEPASFVVDTLPANVLLKRPDLRASLQQLMAAASDIGVAQAQRYPSLSLTGSIGVYGIRIAGQTMQGNSWSFGPVLNLPLFDAGRRKAAVEGADAHYQEALAGFKLQTLQSVKEVEEAMIRLDAANKNLAQQKKIDAARTIAMQAADSGLKAGSYSVLEREDILRQQLVSEQQKLQLQRDRASAWIALYKAIGGDWQSPETDAQAATTE